MRPTPRNSCESQAPLRTLGILSLLLAGLFLHSCDVFSGGSGTVTYDVTVAVDPTGGGTISPSADSTYTRGDSLSLMAEPAEGYVFTEWTGDLDTVANPLELQVNQDYTLTARFVKKNYPLIVHIDEGGQVYQTVLEIDTTNYDHGTQVLLTAEADFDYNFDGWEGDADSTDGNKAWITVTGPSEITARFVKRTFTLSVNTQGQGSVTIDPDSAEYIAGTDVELTAAADAGWNFERWTGDVSDTDNPITVSVDSNMTVNAVFTNPTFEGGNGTEALPFQVSTLEQLQKINSYTDSHFILINDIDATATATMNNGNGFRPLGDDVVQFTGSFDGQGHTISNLFIDRSGQDEIGLFGYVSGATISNLVLTGVDITGGEHTGALAGIVDGGTVENITAAGAVEGADYTGGLIGRVQEQQGDATVIDSGADVAVTGTSFAGGLLGENNGTVRRSYATGTVTATGLNVGGLAGTHNANGVIEESYASGNVTGDEKVGGLVGEAAPQSEISNSHARGDVNGDDTVGGLAGAINSDSQVSFSFATGAVTGNFDVGGFAGANAGTIEGGYWDTQTSGQAGGVGIGPDSGVTGLTTAGMTGSEAETNMTEMDFESIWVIITGNYPELSWQQDI